MGCNVTIAENYLKGACRDAHAACWHVIQCIPYSVVHTGCAWGARSSSPILTATQTGNCSRWHFILFPSFLTCWTVVQQACCVIDEGVRTLKYFLIFFSHSRLVKEKWSKWSLTLSCVTSIHVHQKACWFTDLKHLSMIFSLVLFCFYLLTGLFRFIFHFLF